MITKEQALNSIEALSEPTYRIPGDAHRALLIKYVEQMEALRDTAEKSKSTEPPKS